MAVSAWSCGYTAAMSEPAAISSPPSRRVIVLRLLLVAAGLGAWFWTQSLIGSRTSAPGAIGDGLLEATEPINRFLRDHPAWAKTLLISSSLVIDALGIFLLGRAILGPTLRPFLGLLMLFALRQTCQGLCALPPPEGMIWEHPGFTSLLVTYGVSNDLFFSGHTAIAVYGATELARLDFRGARLAGVAVALFEASTVIVLRAHYTMDVFTGAIAALLVAGAAERVAPAVDRWLAGKT
jgi:hypothetical protein